jgi:hypothetical protein
MSIRYTITTAVDSQIIEDTKIKNKYKQNCMYVLQGEEELVVNATQDWCNTSASLALELTPAVSTPQEEYTLI